MKDAEAAAATSVEMGTTNLLEDGSFYVCFEASTYLMYSAATAALAAVSMTA